MLAFNMLMIILLALIHSLEIVRGAEVDRLVAYESLSSNDILVSSKGVYELGFFSPGSSLKQYVGIWYKLDKTSVIWVANRESPVVKTPGKLTLSSSAMLSIADNENTTVWSSSSNERGYNNMVAMLLDTGNFVVGDEEWIAKEQYAWQGFDYPCDTRIPGMKIGYDVRRKRSVSLSSWKSLDDPAKGEYTFGLDMIGIPQYISRKGLHEIFRLGHWNGETFSGTPKLKPDSVYRFSYTADAEWVYFLHEPIDTSVLSRTVLSANGTWQRFISDDANLVWNRTLVFVNDACDAYNRCGPYATCDTKKVPACECLTGYAPKFQNNLENSTQQCVRETNCSNKDNFWMISNIKVPDTRNAKGDMSLSIEQCRIACLENCSCTAYGNWYVTYGGTGCLQWFGELNDIRVFSEDGQDIFIRGLFHETANTNVVPKSESDIKVVIISSMLSALVLLFIVTGIVYLRRRRNLLLQPSGTQDGILASTENLDLPVYDMKIMSQATNNFSTENKLGQGGFGPVYKGLLQEGQEIAVKKLSHDSKQGSVEFKNEAKCIAKLQHRNLVRLLGYCCDQEEYMLIYEFMPNKSLDLFIFDDKERALLDWPKRVSIITGIARGLLYLHEDSRLRIIHRDLKASNVLLDYDMSPKISDFGLARICGASETALNTTRVVGTYGYMSPEYLTEGLFSVKSDVFSFGVMILEIVSGRRNRGFYHPDHHHNLLGYIWELYNQGRSMEAVDEYLIESYDEAEVTRVIHIDLLCVQEHRNDRPNMGNVVSMLCSNNVLPPPKAPGFFASLNSVGLVSSSGNLTYCSANEMSASHMNPR